MSSLTPLMEHDLNETASIIQKQLEIYTTDIKYITRFLLSIKDNSSTVHTNALKTLIRDIKLIKKHGKDNGLKIIFKLKITNFKNFVKNFVNIVLINY